MPSRVPRNTACPEDLVFHFIRHVRQELDRVLLALPVRLTRLQFGVLYILQSLGSGEATITELAGMSCVEPPTLVAAVHALERNNLVTKTRDRTDHRRLPIRLTPLGLRLLRTIPNSASGFLKTAKQKVGVRKVKIFLDVLACLSEESDT